MNPVQMLKLRDGGLLTLASGFLPASTADRYLTELTTLVAWEQQSGIFGNLQPRLTAAYGEPGLIYQYSGTRNRARPWLPQLLEIKQRIEQWTGKYNFCLLNQYRSGADSIGLHADNEAGLGNVIASLSLGATRTFRIRHTATKETHSFSMEHGSLIIMAGTMQQFWKHEVPKTRRPVAERINLTYRWLEETLSH